MPDCKLCHLGMMDSSVKAPVQATPSISQSGSMINAEVAQPTDQGDTAYKTANYNLSSYCLMFRNVIVLKILFIHKLLLYVL